MNTTARTVCVALCLLLPACSSANGLLYQPKPDDPNDGYPGTLPETGTPTRLDFGPKSETLLADFMRLKEEKAQLSKELDAQKATNGVLSDNIQKKEAALSTEIRLRKQAEAQLTNLEKKSRDLEAKILGLGIEKAKLEQTVLIGKIAELQRSLEDAGQNAVEAAAPPAGKK